MKTPGFLSLEGDYSSLQLLLVTIVCLAIAAGLVFLVFIHPAFLVLTIPGIIFLICVFIISVMKWLSHSEEKDRKLSSLWFWDKKEKQEDDEEEPVIDAWKERDIEKIKRMRDEGRESESNERS